MASKFKLALVQMGVGLTKSQNIERAVSMVKQAASAGADVIALPEYFTSPEPCPSYSEPIPGPATRVLAHTAKGNNVFLIGGSMLEESQGRLYNTSTIFCPQGRMIGLHRKIHLFDIDVPGKISFQESETLTPGNDPTCFDTAYCKVGVGLCFDIRFAELAQLYAQRGCKLLVYPGAFNLTTGPAHWELLQRGRALDNQVYVATVSPARDESADYVTWGHSTVVSPWGEVIAKAGHEEDIVYADIDLDLLQEVRRRIPLMDQRRHDLYRLLDLSNAEVSQEQAKEGGIHA